MKTISRPAMLLMGAVLLLALGVCLVFGRADHAVVACGPSEKFSDAELHAAVRCAKSSFIREFSGCELLKVCYDEDEAQRVIDGYLHHGPGKGTETGEENLLVLFLPLMGISIAYAVFRYMALYDIYKSLDPENCVLFLVLSILFGITEPFFLFFSREKDGGMPPRKQPGQDAPSSNDWVDTQEDEL